MKRTFILLLTGILFLSGTLWAQQLSFRITKPVIYHSGGSPGIDYFRFDLEVKASVSGTFLWSGQAQFTFNNTTLGTALADWTITRGTLLTGTNQDGNPMYTPGRNVVLVGPGGTPPYEIYCYWVGNNDARIVYGGNALDFNEVPTNWTQLAIIRGRIYTNTGVAGIDMHESVFNGNQSYLPNGSTTITPYANPNAFDTKDLNTVYVQRIFNGSDGWTGCGVSTSATLAKASLSTAGHWSIVANTSVYDTTTAAATITNPSSGSLANALRIHSGARLKINPGKDLTCSGNTEINEQRGLVIEASAAGMGQFIDNGTITYGSGGNARAEVYLAQEKWHYYSIPVQSTITAPFFNLYMKHYVEPTRSWRYILDPGLDSILNVQMKGYAMWSDMTSPPMGNYTARVTGSLNTGAMSIPVAYTGNPMDGWCLAGNAYPSAVDLSLSSVTWTKIYQTAWFWDPVAANYTTYIVGGTGLHTKYAPPQQGFFVRHDTNDYSGPGSLAMNNGARVINGEPFLKSDNPLADYLILTTGRSGSEKHDKTVIHFREDATPEYDAIYDAFKLEGDPDAPQSYTRIPGQKVCVNSMPWTDESQVVPLGIYSASSGNFEITASNLSSFREGIRVYLEDLKENFTKELTVDPVYAFAYLTTDNPDRFLIHFANPFVGYTENIYERLQVYSYEDAVYVKNLTGHNISGNIYIYDPTGRLVFTGLLENLPLNRFKPAVTEGFYLVTVKTGYTIKTTKVFLHYN